MIIKHEHLDKRICDVVTLAPNTETFREFIQCSELEFGLEAAPLNDLSTEELNNYLDFLDDLWNK